VPCTVHRALDWLSTHLRIERLTLVMKLCSLIMKWSKLPPAPTCFLSYPGTTRRALSVGGACGVSCACVVSWAGR
jgi:hypothetical protein